MTEKGQIYKQIKIVGFVFYIPTILLSAPLAGHYAGEFLKTAFNTGGFVSAACITVGFIVGFAETVRTLKLISKTSKG